MLWFRKSNAATEQDAPNADDTNKKIALNFRRYSAQQVREMAADTLNAAGFDPSIADPKVGDRMPDGTIYAGDSPDTGKPMYTTTADALQPMEWREARNYAKKLDAHGYKDWRLPTKGELNVLFNNRAAIGRFNVSNSFPVGWYWSGTQVTKWDAWAQRFSDGRQFDYLKDIHPSVRCVR